MKRILESLEHILANEVNWLTWVLLGGLFVSLAYVAWLIGPK